MRMGKRVCLCLRAGLACARKCRAVKGSGTPASAQCSLPLSCVPIRSHAPSLARPFIHTPLLPPPPPRSDRLGSRSGMEWDLRRMESELRQINPDLLQPSKSFKKPSSGTVTINVGGYLYAAQRHTLAKHPGSLLEEVVSGKRPVQHVDSMGNTFIDRDGPIFRHVLNFLRTGDLILPDDFKEVALLRREADFYRLSELGQALQEWEQVQAAQREPAFLEVTDSHERSQGLKVYCSDTSFIEKVKGRLVQISKSRLDGFPEEFEVSSNVIQFRHFIKSEQGSRLVLKEDSTFLCTLETLKLETVMMALRGGFRLLTCLDSSRGSVAQCEALHFVK